jgi:hypothetical protein
VKRIEILCNKDAAVMDEFSRKCFTRLKSNLMFGLFLSFLKDFMDANVVKETKKDKLIIEHAGSAFRKGRSLGIRDTDEIFELTKEIDSEFVEKASVLPLSIHIKYEDFEDIRKERINLIFRAVVALLSAWTDSLSFKDAVRETYTKIQYRDVLSDFLHLYNLETRILSNSIRLLHPGKLAKDMIVGKVFATMETVAQEITGHCTKEIYGIEA